MGEGGITVKHITIAIFYVLSCVVAEANSFRADIQDGTLVRWAKDFNGIAVVPPEVRHIGIQAFSQCRSLTGVVLTPNVETIGHFAFSGCIRLRNVQLPKSVTNIGNFAFADCKSLTNLVINGMIKSISEGMCSRCCGLRFIELPSGVVEIGRHAFCGCRSIREIRMPKTVKSIGWAAFAGCSRMQRVILPHDLQYIDELAFDGCYDMQYLVIPSGFKNAGRSAFRDCYNLKRLIVVERFPGIDDEISICSNMPCTVFAVGNVQNEPVDSTCEGWLRGHSVEYCKSIEEAIAACDTSGKTGSNSEMFKGLEYVLRIAADGLVESIPDTNVPIWKVDAIAANLSKLMSMEDVNDIKKFFADYSATSIDAGDKFIAHICILNDLAITLEFKDDKLAKLTLSDGLKNVIRKKLESEIGEIDESVLRWL